MRWHRVSALLVNQLNSFIGSHFYRQFHIYINFISWLIWLQLKGQVIKKNYWFFFSRYDVCKGIVWIYRPVLAAVLRFIVIVFFYFRYIKYFLSFFVFVILKIISIFLEVQIGMSKTPYSQLPLYATCTLISFIILHYSDRVDT